MKSFDEFLVEGMYDPSIFKAIFLAGGPGSGKSYVAGKATGGLGMKVVNSDDIYELKLKSSGLGMDFTKFDDKDFERSQVIRDRAKKLTKMRMRQWVDGRLGMIIDGTGKDYDKIKAASEGLKGLGYDTLMIFVNTSLDVALQRNQMRSRTLPNDIVKSSWEDVQKNLGKFQSYFGNKNFIIVDNNDASEDVFRKVFVKVRSLVQKPLDNHIAKKWIDKEKKLKIREESNPRIPRKAGQPAGSKKHSDLYTDENPKGTIHGLKFATPNDAKSSVSKIKNSGKKHAHKIQAAIAMEQRAKAAGKAGAASVYRAYINKMKKKTKEMREEIELNEFDAPQIYCDMDGGVADFHAFTGKILGTKFKDAYWQDLPSDTFAKLPLMPDAKRLWSFIGKYKPIMLTAIPRESRGPISKQAAEDKTQWMKSNFNLDPSDMRAVSRQDKQQFAKDGRDGRPNILIDDHAGNIREFKSKGGIGIHHTSAVNTIKQLKQLGFK